MPDMAEFTNSQGLTTSVSIVLRDKTASLVAGDVVWLELSAKGRWDI